LKSNVHKQNNVDDTIEEEAMVHVAVVIIAVVVVVLMVANDVASINAALVGSLW